ncbi:hypothetical protein ES707_01420 [subsurface metagenome]
MNFQEIESIMAAKGLSNDPAFGSLHLLIEEIPCFDGCPLGLFYPDTATIILPPSATDSALLHELGHRHGQYYHDDLSEVYAENFRKAYERGRALLYTGNRFEKLPRLGALFEEGEKGAVEIAFDRPLAMDELHALKDQFYGYGEALPRFFYGVDETPFVRIEFKQGVNWPVIIGAAMAGVTVLTAASLGYVLYKAAEDMPRIVPVSLFAFGAYTVLRMAVREAKKYKAAR